MARFGIVYLPKYVVIHNNRLCILYFILLAVLSVFAIWRFILLEQYAIQLEAKGTVSIMPPYSGITSKLAKTAVDADRTKDFCTQPGKYEYSFSNPANTETVGFAYTNINCVDLCPRAPLGETCMNEHEMNLASSTGTFVPSFFTDTMMTSFGDATPTTSHHWVPGFGGVKLAFSHDFFVDAPADFLLGPRETLVGSSDGSGSEEQSVTTVLLNHSGTVLKTWKPGDMISLSMEEVLMAAKAEEFSDTNSRLILDGRYSNFDERIMLTDSAAGPQGPPLRLTGADLTVKIYYTNKGFCQLDENSEMIVMDVTGPVACMSVRARRDWTQHTRTSVFDADGASLTRTYHGFKVSFDISGQFSTFDSYALFEALTIVFVWLSVPSFIIYLIATFMLGTLSKVYSSVMHQDAGMIETARGIAARLLNYSASFNDLKDAKEGVTKQRMVRRFNYILAYEEDLDANEQDKFVDFVYRSVLNVGADERPPHACDIGSFCTACASGESLSFEVLQHFFDRKRSLGVVEKCFQDASILAIRGLSDADLEQRLNESDSAPLREGGYEGSEPQGSSTGSKLNDILAENMILQQHSADVTSSLNATLKRAAALIGTDDMMRYEINKSEVQKLGGVTTVMPPQTLADGTVYDGEWVGAVRHGKGVMKMPDGAIYVGQFEHGMVHGVASYTLPSGAKYEGQWRLGKQDGDGKETSADGAIYQGQYKEGKKRGKARICLPDGANYMGEVIDGKLNGQGKYTWTNGHTYQGEWEDDLLQGEGTYTWPDGIKYVGQYAKNLKHGSGVLYWPNGAKFEGTYVNNERHSGTMTLACGTVAGEWVDGTQTKGEPMRSPRAAPAVALADAPADAPPATSTAAEEPAPASSQEAANPELGVASVEDKDLADMIK